MWPSSDFSCCDYRNLRRFLVDLSEDHCVRDFLLGWFHILCLIPHCNIRTHVTTVVTWQDWWTSTKISHTLILYTQRATLWINANVNDRSEKESEMNGSQCEAPVHLYRWGKGEDSALFLFGMGTHHVEECPEGPICCLYNWGFFLRIYLSFAHPLPIPFSMLASLVFFNMTFRVGGCCVTGVRG